MKTERYEAVISEPLSGSVCRKCKSMVDSRFSTVSFFLRLSPARLFISLFSVFLNFHSRGRNSAWRMKYQSDESSRYTWLLGRARIHWPKTIVRSRPDRFVNEGNRISSLRRHALHRGKRNRRMFSWLPLAAV